MIPRVLWAQRKDVVFVTFEVFEVKEEKIDIKDNVISFEGVRASDGAKFAVNLELYGAIDASNSKISVGHRDVSLVLAKAEGAGPHWPRLLKSTQKMHYIHTDFSKWIDEDEEDEEELAAMGGMGGMGGNFANFDMSQFAGMGEEGEFTEEEQEESEESEESVKISGLTKNNESFE